MMNPNMEEFTINMDELAQRLRAQGGMTDIAESIASQRTKSSGWAEHGSWKVPVAKPFNVEDAFNKLVKLFGGHSEQ